MKQLSDATVIKRLDAISGLNQGEDHGRADELLLRAVSPEVREAYIRLQKRSSDWWFE